MQIPAYFQDIDMLNHVTMRKKMSVGGAIIPITINSGSPSDERVLLREDAVILTFLIVNSFFLLRFANGQVMC